MFCFQLVALHSHSRLMLYNQQRSVPLQTVTVREWVQCANEYIAETNNELPILPFIQDQLFVTLVMQGTFNRFRSMETQNILQESQQSLSFDAKELAATFASLSNVEKTALQRRVGSLASHFGIFTLQPGQTQTSKQPAVIDFQKKM